MQVRTAPGRLIIQDLIILWSNVCVAVLDFKRLNIGVELPGMRLYTFASAKLRGALLFYVFVCKTIKLMLFISNSLYYGVALSKVENSLKRKSFCKWSLITLVTLKLMLFISNSSHYGVALSKVENSLKQKFSKWLLVLES